MDVRTVRKLTYMDARQLTYLDGRILGVWVPQQYPASSRAKTWSNLY